MNLCARASTISVVEKRQQKTLRVDSQNDFPPREGCYYLSFGAIKEFNSSNLNINF
jgi:hypothetical protein